MLCGLQVSEPRQLEERGRERARETLSAYVQVRDAAVRTLDMVVKGAAAGIQHRRRTLGKERGGEVRVAAEVLPCVAVAGSEIRRAACASARGSFTFHCTSRDVRICPCRSKGTYALAVCCVT